MTLTEYYKEVPEFFIGNPPDEILKHLDKPTLIHLKGRDSSNSVIVVGMLHGDERCGFYAIVEHLQGIRNKDSTKLYEHDVVFLIGNVKAAKEGIRYTNLKKSTQQNYNRIWGTAAPKTKDEEWAKEVEEYIRSCRPTHLLDMHSFSGKNQPPHAYITQTKKEFVELASNFADFVLIASSKLQGGAPLIASIADVCPAAVVECGTNNTKEADSKASEVLEQFLQYTGTIKSKLEPKKVPTRFFKNMRNVRLKEGKSFDFSNNPKKDVDITLVKDFGSLGFKDLGKGKVVAYVNDGEMPFTLIQDGEESINQYFKLKDNKVVAKKKLFPALTKDNKFNLSKEGFYLFDEVKSFHQ